MATDLELPFRSSAGDLSLDKKRELCERDAPVASNEAIEVCLGTAAQHGRFGRTMSHRGSLGAEWSN